MAKPEILEEHPINMVELKEELGAIKKRDKELGVISNKTEEYLNQFVTIPLKLSSTREYIFRQEWEIILVKGILSISLS